MVDTVTIHLFEQSGLGKAPFTFLRVMENTYTPQGGSYAQPAGTCRYCGNGIKYEYWLRSADGREFCVGSECVHKSGDAGLRKVVKDAERAQARKARETKRVKDFNELKALLYETRVRFALSCKPHPLRNATLFLDKTAFDYYKYLLENGMIGYRAASIIRYFRELNKLEHGG